MSPPPAVPSVIEGDLVFSLEDAERAYVRVGLDCDDAVIGRRRFRRTANGWLLSIPRPDLNRLEYRLVVTDRNGDTQVVCDPANPERVRTAFGDRSVALMPGYERPRWLQQQVEAGRTTDQTITPMSVPVTLWSPPGLGPADEARLLVVHDGPEYVDLADLAHYAASVISSGEVPVFRMALMHPVERDPWYAANTDYVEAELTVLDRLVAQVPTTRPWATLGASLGGLTSLLLALRGGGRFGGVLAQSASFFTHDLDPQESTYPFFDRVADAVREIEEVEEIDRAERPLQVAITCGRLEENFANNDAMAAVLADRGHLVTFVPVPDLHNYTAWRDALHPTLTDLLRTLWGTRWMEEEPEE